MARAHGADQFWRVLGDRHRWAILSLLAHSDHRVGELTEMLGERQNLVSYHLAELRDAGLVSSRRSSFDGRDTYYHLELERCGELLCASAAALHPALQLAPAVLPLPAGRRRPPRVLFLCTGNSARSQMAEALLEHRSVGTVQARSAGSHPKALHSIAVQVMADRGIDISTNTAKHVRRYARSHFDRVITLCDKVREVCPELPGEPATPHWSMADPTAEGGDDAATYPAFERTADELDARIGPLIAQLSMTRGGPAHAR